MNSHELIQKIMNGNFDIVLSKLYDNIENTKDRYIKAIKKFVSLYGDGDLFLFSVPGRTEISGNHTDHNHGKVIAAAVNLDIIAIAAKRNNGLIRITSEGYNDDTINTEKLDPSNYKQGSSDSLVAGTCNYFREASYKYGGFDAYTISDVMTGSGLSSSAAFEVMIGNILNFLYNNGNVSAVKLAQIAQKSENVYFGKPCGLMDQTACSVGGFVAMDFLDPENPVVEKINENLSDFGYSLCITDTGGNHADLTDDYSSVPSEMKAVAEKLGKSVLREVDENEFYKRIPELRKSCGDRAVLRAIHFFNENKRVSQQISALTLGNIDVFLKLASQSGDSSFKYLQNVYTNKNIREQGLSLALALSSEYISRVHGGGFAGTIQAFVPSTKVESYKKTIESVFGDGSCKLLSIRNYGAVMINEDRLVSPPIFND